MNFKNVPKKYRPIPFWSWNEKLDTVETARQINIMHNAGLGGFFMHARGGLQTKFMGDEWFENVTCSVEEAKKLDMDAWAYDENGWPSGFGGGRVTGKGKKYQQKHLRMENGERNTPYTLYNWNGYHFYYDVNPFYSDNLDAEVVADFINEIYEPYYKKYKNEIKGFFTDEPQLSGKYMTWSLKLPDEYKKTYGEDLIERMPELFFEVGNYKDTRIKYWKLVTDLFSKNYMKQIYNWCNERGLCFTGHLRGEETIGEQIVFNGACMPHYEYFNIPGMDWIGRSIYDCLTTHQLGSVSQQLGKKQVLSETFALCGHNVGFEELRRIYEWQMVRGVNLLCQHLEGYSLRGIRKRDYPPAMYYQQPWWSEYHKFNDSMARIGMLLAKGDISCDVLLIHPQTTMWALFDKISWDNGDGGGVSELMQSLLDTIKILEQKHIPFHLGDETIMERHARVDGNGLVIGEIRYTTVIMLPDTLLLDNTKKLLQEYELNGGKLLAVEELVPNDIIDNENITYTKRLYDEFTMHYLVNSTEETQKAYIKEGARYLDIITGDLQVFNGKYEFAPFESLVVIDDGTQRIENLPKKELTSISLDGDWNITEQTHNVLTLDYCKYFFDEVIQEENGYVLNIQERACALKRPVKIKQEFGIKTTYLPKELYLVVETPEIFDISVNGELINIEDKGCFLDKAFRKIDISKYFVVGENTITMKTEFRQSETLYENLEKAKHFETEKNKLVYDIEIEPIYIVGQFGVSMMGKAEDLDRKAIRFNGEFAICEPRNTISLINIEKQGYPFFAGSITIEKKIQIEDISKKIVFNKNGINAIKVCVNEESVDTVIWNPTELDLSQFLKLGENTIKLTLINNLRNMMGPHHMECGESYSVTPAAFFKEDTIWGKWNKNKFNKGYCFVEFGAR